MIPGEHRQDDPAARRLEDGNLTYSVTSPDVPSAQVIRTAIRDWDRELPAITLTEVPASSLADITIRFTPGEGRTEGQAVTSFTRRGLISRVEITIQGALAPGNSGGLGQIAKHEFGHALGLGHTNYEGNLMSPAVSPDPQPVPACVIQGVIEANRWKMIAPPARRPQLIREWDKRLQVSAEGEGKSGGKSSHCPLPRAVVMAATARPRTPPSTPSCSPRA